MKVKIASKLVLFAGNSKLFFAKPKMKTIRVLIKKIRKYSYHIDFNYKSKPIRFGILLISLN